MKALPTPPQQPWNGYTLEELQYRRILVGTRMAIEKQRLATAADQFRQNNALLNGTLMARIAGSVSWIQYAVIAFRTFRTIRSFFKK